MNITKGERSLSWPDSKRFGFSIIDDTDNATLAKVKPFYDALQRYGLLTTKTIWSLPSPAQDPYWAESLADDHYRDWLHQLERNGFEIGWHGARSGGSDRAVVERGLELFRQMFGAWPRTYANHARNTECLYWGAERFDNPLLRLVYRRLRDRSFYGSSLGNAHYWGDLCSDRIRYVRGFTYSSIVTSEADPWSPFFDARRPDVRAWFSAAHAPNKAAFLRLLDKSNVDRLARTGGFCIVYTHVAVDFVDDGVLDVAVEKALAYLSGRPGWFVPVEALLGRIEDEHGVHAISRLERRTLENRFVIDNFRRKLTPTTSSKR